MAGLRHRTRSAEIEQDTARRGGEAEHQSVVKQEIQTEGEHQRNEHRLGHHWIDDIALQQITEREQNQSPRPALPERDAVRGWQRPR